MTDQYSQNPGASNPNQARIPVKLHAAADKPVVTYTILALTIVVFGLQYLSRTLSANQYDWPYLLGAKVNDLILAGQVWRLITPILLHASILHIGFNMYALFVIGPQLERFYGHKRFLLLYLITGFTGNVLSFVL